MMGLVIKVFVVLAVIAVLVFTAYILFSVITRKTPIGVPSLERDKDKGKIRRKLTEAQSAENDNLAKKLKENIDTLGEVETMLRDFRSTVKQQLANPYYMDRRVATVRALYSALGRAKDARPELNDGERPIDRRSDIEKFIQEMAILDSSIRKAVAEGANYKLNDSELELWRRTKDLYVEVLEKPSSNEYSRNAQMAEFRELCERLPFIDTSDVLDLDPA